MNSSNMRRHETRGRSEIPSAPNGLRRTLMTAEGRETTTRRREMFLGCPIDLYTMKETLGIAERAMRQRTPTRHVVVNVAKLVNMRRDTASAQGCLRQRCHQRRWHGGGLGRPAARSARPRTRRRDRPDGASPASLQRQRVSTVFPRGTSDVLLQAIANLARRHPSLEIAGSAGMATSAPRRRPRSCARSGTPARIACSSGSRAR